MCYKNVLQMHHIILGVYELNSRRRQSMKDNFVLPAPSEAVHSDQILCAASLIDHLAACSRTCFENGPLQ